MKKTTLTFCLILLYVGLSFTTLHAQTINSPQIEWQKSYWPDHNPWTNNSTADKTLTGEDWFYDIRIAKNNNGVPDGYICAGYSDFVNQQPTANSCISPYGTLTAEEINDFESTTNRRGCVRPKLAEIDLDGKKLWYTVYGTNYGWFNTAIQTSDKKYLAVGLTLDIDKIYNPTSSSSTATLSCNSNDNRHIYIVKTDDDGFVIWQFIYGIDDNIATADISLGEAFDVVELNNGNFRIVGSVTPYDMNNLYSHTQTFIMDITPNGYVVWKGIITSVSSLGNADFSVAQRIIKSPTTDECIIVGKSAVIIGTSSVLQAYCAKIPAGTYSNSSLPSLTNIKYFYGTTNTLNTKAFDVAYLGSDVLIGVVKNCNSCSNAHGEGEGYILKLDGTTLITIATYPIGYPLGLTSGTKKVKAYDLKLGITTTSDGGFATVSTVQQAMFNDADAPHPPTSSGVLNYHKELWNTDGYVAKFSSTGTMEWEKVFNTNNPYGTSYPDDVKREECLYHIQQTPDGGYIVAGNNSANFDDDYVVKLYDDCDNRQTYDLTDISDGSIDGKINISSNTLWTSSQKILGSVHVKSGAILTISGSSTNIQFADTKRTQVKTNLIIEPGGKVIVTNGATLTSLLTCPYSQWDGILVEGDPTKDQLPTTNQGVIILNAATIKNASNAISTSSIKLVNNVWVTDWSKTGGGIIKANNTNFINNDRHVAFWSYQRKPISLYNSSSFYNCNFEVNGSKNIAVLGYNNTQTMITAWEVRGVHFTGCTFKNTNPNDNATLQNYDRGTGIYTYDASVIVDGIINGYCTVTQRGNFLDLSRGVNSVFSPNSVHTGLIKQQDFTRNDRAIVLNNGFASTVHHNNFDLNVPATYFNRQASPGAVQLMNTGIVGILTNTAAGYQIQQNTFTLNTQVANEVIAAMVTDNSDKTAGGGTYRLNTMSGSNIGTQTQNDNANIQISCNMYNNLNSALKLNPVSFGNTPLFGKCDPNNALLRTDYNNTFSISSPNKDAEYYPASTSIPTSAYKIYVVDPTANASPSKGIHMDFNKCLGQTVTSKDPSCLLNSALQDVCILPIWNGGDKKNGYYFNKQARKGVIDDIKNNNPTGNVLAQAQSDLIFYTAEMVQARATLLWQYNINSLYDSTINYTDSIIYFLTPETDTDSRKLLIAALYYAGNFEQAQSYLNALSNTFEDGSNDNETIQFKAFYMLLISVKNNARSVFQLSDEEWGTINSISSSGTAAAVSAKGILTLVKGQYFADYIEREATSFGKKGNTQEPVIKAKPLTTVSAKPIIGVYPNPANNSITVSYVLNDFSDNINIEIKDITGKTILSRTSNSMQSSIEFNSAFLRDGMYFIQIYADKKLVTSSKVVIQH